ncbi:MAG: hypothetical protein LBG27_09615 [Spirochaetaceae bacterium]|jgi:hypothetical protein|nr:hypothetical protein [Spirochaetaceae bacterium]
MDGAVSNAARVLLAVIPIVGIVMGSVVVFFWMLWTHKRKVLLIKNNLYEKLRFDLLNFSLLTGLLLAIVGITLTVFLIFTLGKSYGLLGGLIPLAIGTALLIYYAIQRPR